MAHSYKKSDLEKAFNAGRRKRFDTGVSLYQTFEEWYKQFVRSIKEQ